MKYPKVSVIIPYYNGQKFINEAVNSILKQTYKDFEIIVVDDGSEIKAKNVIKSLHGDSRIKIIEYKQNKGIPSARNTGIRHSKGKYIAFLDQDDIWLPNKLEQQIGILDKPSSKVDMVFGKISLGNYNNHSKQYPQKDRLPLNINKLSSKDIIKALFLDNFIPIVTVVIRKKCIEKIGVLDENLTRGSDDYEFCFRIAAKCRIHFLDNVLVIRRIHETNFSNTERFFIDNLYILNKILLQYPFLINLKRKRLSVLYYRVGRYYQQKGDFPKAKNNLWESVKNSPLNIKNFIAFLISLLGHKGNQLFNIYKQLFKRNP